MEHSKNDQMKSVVISGGAGGIGRVISQKYAENGFVVYVLDTNLEALLELRKTIGNEQCVVENVDVTNVTELEKVVCKYNFNRLSHIVTLAGRALDGEWDKFENQTFELFHDSINVNLIGHINVIKAFYKSIQNSIINNKSITMISSINALRAYGLPAYSASKAGLSGFMNATTSEFGEKNIRINLVSPGTVATEATLSEPKDFDALLRGTVLNKFVTPHDVADVVYGLSEKMTMITGQNIVVDAGQSKKTIS